MKKVISILLLLALLLTFAGCGSKPEPTEPEAQPDTPADEAEVSAEEETLPMVDPFTFIDETVPVDGVYQVHSPVGVKNMLEHPEGSFVMLRDVDMEGAVLQSMGTAFTGEFDGGRFTISNFSLEPAENGDVGLFGENKGTVKNVILNNVTISTAANSRYIGSLAAVNSGTISRCGLTGSITVAQAAEDVACGGVVGLNSGSITNSEFTVDVTYSAPGTAMIGGLCGSTTGGKLDTVDNFGGLEITGGEGKTVGLLLGTAEDTEVKACGFVGPVNTVDGVRVENLTGSQQNTVLTKCSWRDNSAEPLPAAIQAKRDKVVQTMYDMAMVEWKVSQTLYHDCTCSLNACHGAYTAGMTYVGLPYNHKGGNLERLEYCKDENDVMYPWVYEQGAFDGFDIYVGNDCSTAILHSWWTVSNSVDFMRTRFQMPNYRGMELGIVPVGDWAWDEELDTYKSLPYIEASGEQAVYESYAEMRKGDVIFYNPQDVGGHTKMAATDPVVVRYQDGTINPELSYILTHEQGVGEVHDPETNSITTWGTNTKMTFASLYVHEALPVTCKELLTEETVPATATMEMTLDGKAGMFTGFIKTSYYLDSVDLLVTDGAGNVAFEKRMFPSTGKYYDAGSNDTLIRNYIDEYDMAHFATALQQASFEKGESYTYTVTANLATGDCIVVKEGSFTQGTA